MFKCTLFKKFVKYFPFFFSKFVKLGRMVANLKVVTYSLRVLHQAFHHIDSYFFIIVFGKN